MSVRCTVWYSSEIRGWHLHIYWHVFTDRRWWRYRIALDGPIDGPADNRIRLWPPPFACFDVPGFPGD